MKKITLLIFDLTLIGGVAWVAVLFINLFTACRPPVWLMLIFVVVFAGMIMQALQGCFCFKSRMAFRLIFSGLVIVIAVLYQGYLQGIKKDLFRKYILDPIPPSVRISYGYIFSWIDFFAYLEFTAEEGDVNLMIRGYEPVTFKDMRIPKGRIPLNAEKEKGFRKSQRRDQEECLEKHIFFDQNSGRVFFSAGNFPCKAEQGSQENGQ